MGTRSWRGHWMLCITAAATPTTFITLPVSLSFPELAATMDNPLASHVHPSLDLNLGTVGVPQSKYSPNTFPKHMTRSR